MTNEMDYIGNPNVIKNSKTKVKQIRGMTEEYYMKSAERKDLKHFSGKGQWTQTGSSWKRQKCQPRVSPSRCQDTAWRMSEVTHTVTAHSLCPRTPCQGHLLTHQII